MSNTPRTDEALKLYAEHNRWVKVDFARQLEIKLADARKALNNIAGCAAQYLAHRSREHLEELEAEIESAGKLLNAAEPNDNQNLCGNCKHWAQEECPLGDWKKPEPDKAAPSCFEPRNQQ